MQDVFPGIIKKLPKLDFGIPGLTVHSDRTPSGTVWFVSAEREVEFPEHAHGAQWTIVVAGRCRLTFDGQTKEYAKGDTYTIPASVPHRITLFPGYAEVDWVADEAPGEIEEAAEP